MKPRMTGIWLSLVLEMKLPYTVMVKEQENGIFSYIYDIFVSFGPTIYYIANTMILYFDSTLYLILCLCIHKFLTPPVRGLRFIVINTALFC